MRLGAWTDDIADPSEITSYFVDYSEHPGPAFGLERTTRPTSCSSRASRRWTRRSGPTQYKQIQQIYMAAAPILFIYETPYPVALPKKVKGFMQIPLGNNIFVRTSIEK